MGMFDYIRCDYPLPGIAVQDKSILSNLQTKDTDEIFMSTYVITEDGRVIDPDGKPYLFTGSIDFGGSNVSMAWNGEMFTTDGRDYESVDYVALFDDGKLLVLKQTAYERHPARSAKDGHDAHQKYLNSVQSRTDGGVE